MFVNFYFFYPDPVIIMNGTKDKNETAIEITQKNKNANKKAVKTQVRSWRRVYKYCWEACSTKVIC
jgi:hypothetical protein